jgi:hypothetical protein
MTFEALSGKRLEGHASLQEENNMLLNAINPQLVVVLRVMD